MPKVMKDVTATTVIRFVEEELVHSFGPPKTIVSGNASCCTSEALQELITELGISWKTVLAYATMSNGRVERMVGTIEKSVDKIVVSEP